MALTAEVHSYLSSYSVIALENTPRIIKHLLGGYSRVDPVWDYRPSADRFSLREAVAHLADWNDIYKDRLERTLNEDEPDLPNCDEGQIAVERNYAQSDPLESIERVSLSRKPLVALIKSLSPQDWDRRAKRVGLGYLNLGEQIEVIVGHDAYHLRQVMDYTLGEVLSPV